MDFSCRFNVHLCSIGIELITHFVPRVANLHRKFIDQPIVPNRVVPPLPILAPAPMSEVERNMSLYLHTLHSRLSAIAGPTVTALKAWDTFMDVTKEMPMKWDQENRDRFVLKFLCLFFVLRRFCRYL